MLITSSAEEIAYLTKKRPGTVFAYPTETVYGLGCPITDDQAIERIINIKGRNAAKGMIVLVSGLHQAKALAKIDSRHELLLGRFWPGALSAVMKINSSLHETAAYIQNGTIAIRVSPHPLAAELTRFIGPIISTSANPSGMKPANCREDIISYGLDIDAILDGGKIKDGLPSTLIDLTGEEPSSLREGAVPFEKILEFWNQLPLSKS
jgi:L-threonylcarbamoyladenylate synthase